MRFATITAFAVYLFAAMSASAQTLKGPGKATDVQKLQDAASKGFKLRSNITVRDNVSVEAILLPAPICRKVFGKEIAKNYAAVEIVVSNRNPDASLIIHSVFIDYTQW